MPSFSSLRFETPRLVLRPFRHTDAADLFTVFADPQVYRYIPVGAWKLVDESHQRIARDIEKMANGEYVRLAVERREDARVLGEVLLFNFSAGSKRAELGYAIARDAWGSGYTGEALPPLVAFGFRELDLARMHATIDPRNGASARVLERLGFQLEGTLREHSIMRGEVSDDAIYGLLRREWEAKQP